MYPKRTSNLARFYHLDFMPKLRIGIKYQSKYFAQHFKVAKTTFTSIVYFLVVNIFHQIILLGLFGINIQLGVKECKECEKCRSIYPIMIGLNGGLNVGLE